MKNWTCGCLSVLLCALPVHAGQNSQREISGHGVRVLEVSTTAAPLTKERPAAWERLQRSEGSFEWIIPIHFEREALDNDVAEADLFDTHVVIRRVDDGFPRFERSARRIPRRWRGQVFFPGEPEDREYDSLREATFDIFPNGRVGGTIRLGELVYKLSASGPGPGGYALTKQDLARLNKDANDVFDPEAEPPAF